MTHAATVQTAPDLQALFDQDWTSGKYRRPKCSKSDFYAGWLVAYERFQRVQPIEKIAAVPASKPAAKTARPKQQKKIDGVPMGTRLCTTPQCNHATVKNGIEATAEDRGEHYVSSFYYGSPESRARLLATDMEQMRRECDNTFWTTNKRFSAIKKGKKS